MASKTLLVFGERATLKNMRWTSRVPAVEKILNLSRNVLPITSVEEGEEAEIQRVKMLFGATDV